MSAADIFRYRADIFRYRLECYLAALSLADAWRPLEIATLQGRAGAMRVLLGIELRHPESTEVF